MSTPSAKNGEILVVDDSIASLNLLDRILTEGGHRVRLADDGKLALRSVEAKLPELVLLDVRMPGMDGYEVCRRLKANEESSSIPVVFISVAGSEQDRVKGFAAGAVDYVYKPFSGEEVLARVNAHLSLRRAQLDLELRNEELELASRNLDERVRARSAELEKANQELRELSRRKDEFLAMLGHELRNPLAPIRNAGSILKLRGTKDPSIKHVQEIIERQSLHLTRIVDELLDSTRLTQGKLELQKETLDWTKLVRASMEDIKEDAQQKGIKLSTSYGEGVWVLGDPIRLTQVAWNLLVNSLKFTDPGGEIEVSLYADMKSDKAIFTVHDTGIGMSQATLSQLFKPFTKGKDSPRKGGLGLGLVLSKALVDLHGGSIKGASEGVGRGSTFTVRMPLAKVKATAVNVEGKAEVKPHSHLRILVIEDNVDASESLGEFLRMSGYSVYLASDGTEGIQKAQINTPAVVLCDIGLPGEKDGYDVAREIRANPMLNPVYLIALTGYGQDADKCLAKQAGFNLHMTKPVDPYVLIKVLARIRDASSIPTSVNLIPELNQ